MVKSTLTFSKSIEPEPVTRVPPARETRPACPDTAGPETIAALAARFNSDKAERTEWVWGSVNSGLRVAHSTEPGL